MEAAGIEPCCERNTNLMTARDFGLCALQDRRLDVPPLLHSSPIQSTGIDPRHGDILETGCVKRAHHTLAFCLTGN